MRCHDGRYGFQIRVIEALEAATYYKAQEGYGVGMNAMLNIALKQVTVFVVNDNEQYAPAMARRISYDNGDVYCQENHTSHSANLKPFCCLTTSGPQTQICR